MDTIEVQPLDVADPVVATAIWRLQRAAYQVEADLIGSEGIPPLQEPLEELIAAPLNWLGVCEPDGRVVAALAYVDTHGHIDIDRLMVAPDRFRTGCGAALVGALDSTATVTVSTGMANLPARRLYEGQGFSRTHDEMVDDALWITHFVREGSQ